MEARIQTLGEEIANSITHGLGLVGAVAAAPLLIIAASQHTATNVVAAAVFAATMVLLYSASTIYHALPAGRAKRAFVKLDHGAIYLFIAGSYTPFTLCAIGGAWGWSLFALVWAMAVLGVTLKAFDRLSRPWLSTTLYLVMGWLVVVAIGPLVASVPAAGIALLVAGGVAYTAGVAFFVLDSRWRYAHSVWHGFVIAGTGCHFFAVLGYAA